MHFPRIWAPVNHLFHSAEFRLLAEVPEPFIIYNRTKVLLFQSSKKMSQAHAFSQNMNTLELFFPAELRLLAEVPEPFIIYYRTKVLWFQLSKKKCQPMHFPRNWILFNYFFFSEFRLLAEVPELVGQVLPRPLSPSLSLVFQRNENFNFEKQFRKYVVCRRWR